MSARQNLELKATDPDPQRTLRRALELGADDRGEFTQRDTYFRVPRGRLKLREAPPAPAQLISYSRPSQSLPKVSSFRIAEVPDAGALTASLSETIGIAVVVEKTRRLLLWDGVRIHLDQVVGLGCFVELEAMASSATVGELEQRKVDQLRKELELSDQLLVALGYADLLAAKELPGARAATVEDRR